MRRILLFEQHKMSIKDPIFDYCRSERFKKLLGNKRSERFFNLLKGHQGVGYDILGNKLDKAPLKEGQTSYTYEVENNDISPGSLDNKIYVFTNKVPSDYKYLDSYVPGNGWIKVWEEKGKPGEISNIVKNYDTKLFNLGAFKMNESFKKKLQSDIDEVVKSSELIEVIIESSTDKTPLTQQLKKELSDLGYTPDNQGLSKARAEQISSILVEKQIPKDKIRIENLFELGSEPKTEEERLKLVRSKEGYDPKARYVNINFKVKGKGDLDFFYFQKINFRGDKGKVERSFLIPFTPDETHCGYDK